MVPLLVPSVALLPALSAALLPVLSQVLLFDLSKEPRVVPSKPASASGPSGQKKGGFADPLGYDPARSRPALSAAELVGKRVDLPADAYISTAKEAARFAARPSFNTMGKAIKVQLNIFPVTKWEDKDIVQYDLTISPNPRESRGLIKKVWESEPVRAWIKESKRMWLYDGNKLAWSSGAIDRGEGRISVDLDAGKPARPGRESVFYCHVRQTKCIRLSYLRKYLQGEIPWDTHVLECMNFLDHCVRQYPSENLLSIRRNFYAKKYPEAALGRYIVARKGFYSAIRLSESIKSGGTGLSLNVDVANTAFWAQCTLEQLWLRFCITARYEWGGWDYHEFIDWLQPRRGEDKKGNFYIEQSEPFALHKKMNRIKFNVIYNNQKPGSDKKIHTFKRVLFDLKYGPEGATAHKVTFDRKLPDGTVKETSIYDYYLDKYKLKLKWPGFPIIETMKGDLFPIELCWVADFQRYMTKLEPDQTAQMIKFAVTRPPARKTDIMKGVGDLKWNEDPYLRAFGIRIQDQMVITNARLLKNPVITFGGNQRIDPGVSGRWDLRGKKFLETNAVPLKYWTFAIIGKACTMTHAEQFANKFGQAYRTHGGRVDKTAIVLELPHSMGDIENMIRAANRISRERFKEYPQIIFFILESKNVLNYERIKKNMDCRYNIVSQCLQGGHVEKCNAQYMSNVAMKVNAKLGGVTCKIAGPTPTQPPFFRVPTMMIGLDVSHAAPGSLQPSMAAMTVSMDRHATRYSAACETNGYRAEVVSGEIMHGLFTGLLQTWVKNNGGIFPQHVYYLRDGCAEGQFQQVLEFEISQIRRIFREGGAPKPPRFTVIVATKRHHIRFFPKPGDKDSADRNANPLPGTLVEHDATHPFHYDFYLASHVAIQGTARPVHYQVIYDDAEVKPDLLQQMIYHQCYQYCRSTTPVSLHPAVYYSHLASLRAKAHEDIASSQKELGTMKAGFPIMKEFSEIYSSGQPSEAPKLLPMMNKIEKVPEEVYKIINNVMWYV
ncbi:eukaryotic translation initiation factor [Xylariaceae sp. FL0804]|nr:eukaryotic translation initiation factor [Xylariaceae sp. FL0804]